MRAGQRAPPFPRAVIPAQAGIHFRAQRNYGLIAQEVEKGFPDLVSTDRNGYKRVNYSELPFLILQGVRELKTQDDALRGRVSSQQAEILALRAEVKRLRRQQTALASLEERLERLEARQGGVWSASAK